MFAPTKLTSQQVKICERTISSNAFFLIVQSALMERKGLSVVRMADGEWLLYKQAIAGEPQGMVDGRSAGWLKNLGCAGITNREIERRLVSAASGCDYFSPSISGITDPEYDLYRLFRPRNVYVDNFFCNQWDEWMVAQLYKLAGRVILIHRKAEVADALQIRAKEKLGVAVSWIRHDNWNDSVEVVHGAAAMTHPLVIASVGPAGKFILPRIATGSNPKVVLDIGNTIDRFTLSGV
jgi:hypothetical protein